MREYVLVFLGLLAAGFLWLGEAALPGHMPADYTLMRDTYHLAVICERWGHWLRQGELAIWMPEFAGGHPVHALWMYGLLHPASLLWAVLPIELAYTWGALLHLAFGGTGLHAYLRGRGLRWEAALCGAIVFALSEYVLVKIGTGGVNQLWALAWVPWVLRAVERAAAGERGAVPALGLWTGLALLAGHIQVWIFMGPALAAYAVVLAAGEPDAARRFGRVAAGAALALGAAAVQWLPTAELMTAAGDRPHVEASQLHDWSASGVVLAGKVLPGIFGSRPGTYWGGEDFDHEHAGLTGVGVLLLALLGLRRGDRRVAFFAWTAVAGLVLALGYRHALTGWLSSLPVIGWSRVPGRAQSLTVLGGAVLAAHGVASMLDGRLPLRALARRGGVTALVAVVCGVVVAGSTGPDVGTGRTLWHAGMLALTGGVVVAGALHAVRKHPRAAAWVPAAVLITVVASAPRVGSTSTGFLDLDWTPALPAAARGHRVHLGDFRLPYVERRGVRTFRRPAHVEPASTRLLQENISAPVAAWMDIAATLVRDEMERGPPVRLPEIVKVFDAPLPPRGPARLFVTAQSDVGDAVAIRRMATGEDVLLLADAAPAPGAAPGPAGVISTPAPPRPRDVVFTTDAPGPRWLFASEKWYPGWEATIDGAPTDVHRANVAFRAVAVPAGRHRVAFHYRPWTFLVGAIGSLVTIALLGLSAARGRRKR